MSSGGLLELFLAVWGRSWGLGAVLGVSWVCVRASLEKHLTRPSAAATANWSNNAPFWAFSAAPPKLSCAVFGLFGAVWGAPLGRQGPLEPWKPSWACLGAVSGLSWDPGPWESFKAPQHRSKPAANWSNNGRSCAVFAGPLGPLEGLRAPQHHGKPGANSSNNGPPYWLPPGTLMGRLKAFLG